jgi:formamidopyrimidine-DNA glycosylase
MPELPEVETIKRGLQNTILGHTIKDVIINLPKQISGDTNTIIGAKITAVRRYGKGLIIDLSNDMSIAAHVKMTGQLLYKEATKETNETASNAAVAEETKGESKKIHLNLQTLPDKYTHVVFMLDKGAVLFYRDIRQFGWLKIVRTEEALQLPFFKSLGMEPPVTEPVIGKEFMTLDSFKSIVRKRKTPIKLLILDQSQIAGLGNIYANDALYVAGIHPTRPASSLSEKEIELLFEAINMVLIKGISVGGASEWNYVNAFGVAGKYQNFFQIYHKTGQPCPKCGTIIENMKIGGRGTFYCPECQK